MAEPKWNRQIVYRPKTSYLSPFLSRPTGVVNAMAAVPSSTPGMKSLKGIIAGLLCLSPAISFRKKYYSDCWCMDRPQPRLGSEVIGSMNRDDCYEIQERHTLWGKKLHCFIFAITSIIFFYFEIVIFAHILQLFEIKWHQNQQIL